MEKCPFCKEQIDPESLPRLEDEGDMVTCDHCNKKFHVYVSISYWIETNCKDNEEEHDWYRLSNGVECCKNCDELR